MDHDVNIILIDDEPAILKSLAQFLDLEGYKVKTFTHASQALATLSRSWAGMVISDINMPGMDGIEFISKAFELDAEFSIVMLTGHGDVSIAVDTMRLGAYDFVEKPVANDHLLDIIKRAIDRRRLVLENRELRDELTLQSGPGPRILGNSEKIKSLRKILLRIKDTPADVLINGETGSGKDLIARFLHDNSNRRNENFVAINCGAVPETMIESELFGFEAGAFTGASKKRVGKIEHANKGTFFLDEIESMPMPLQIKLLRVLEERKVEPLGSNKQIALDVRFIAAAKSDLKALAASGEFREDLYYRLNVINIHIPPLRERIEDISLLFQHFASIAATRFGIEPTRLNPEQLYKLQDHNWPGNIRELRNAAERFVLMGTETVFTEETTLDIEQNELSLAERVARFERTIIQEALTLYQGRLGPLQDKLGLPRKTLYDKMKKYGLTKEDYK